MAEFDKLCDLVGKFHGHFCRQLRDATRRHQDLNFFFGGFCPLTKKVRVARFTVDEKSGASHHEEILTKKGESFDTLGAGPACRRFRELIELSLSGPPCRVHYAAFRRLRDVIVSGKFHSVGGAIQYGEFAADGNFRLFGSGMLEMGEIGPVMKTFIRGTNVEDVHQPKGPTDLYIGYSAMAPFNEDIQQFDSTATFWTKEGTRVMLDELITVLPHDASWRSSFLAERRRLRAVFPRNATIEHIGSTAVPALPAVPVVDIIAGVDGIDSTSVPMTRLAKLGYQYLGPQRDGSCHVFRKRGAFSFNLFVISRSNDFWRTAIALREFFRADETAAREYASEKMRILNAGGWTLYRYNREKSGILIHFLPRALEHTAKSGSRPTSWRSWLSNRLDWIRSLRN